ncbi:unnamed protein product [Polarella glacialis]|uniref:Uncharacterized protein n=1 Tax=Polarella glacialis TaxID=89957 RepID=A0A813G5L1_POLGL|nr:unnamed protein product [Polarella glacialis]|mmetsp:Transcript_66675/g.120002  ORF Transcript_66675/g.120002 Transcript_66675/m.120002 type:complete len:330 (+) Transcript_66675:114-1103(+)
MAAAFGLQLRYPTAQGMDFSADLPERDLRRASGKGGAGESGEVVSIDRRMFRPLRRPRAAAEPAKAGHQILRGQSAGHRGAAFPVGEAFEAWSAHSADEEEFPAQSRAAPCRAALDGAPAFAAQFIGRRLAGNGIEEDGADSDLEDFLDGEDGYELAAGGSRQGAYPYDDGYQVGALGRSNSSPELLRQQRQGGRQPDPFQHQHHHHHYHYDHPQHGDMGDTSWSTPPRHSASGACESPWMTPEPRRRAVSRADPVSRGAHLRSLWGRDRFLQSTGTRKFDLRGCGSPAKASPQRGSQLLIPRYVPPHEKRRDNVRMQVRMQMREPDFY